MIRSKTVGSIVCMAVLLLGAVKSQAEIILAFQANSVGTDHIFTMVDTDPGVGQSIQLLADNTLDLTLSINDSLQPTYVGANFSFSADVTSIVVEAGTGTFFTLENIEFSFETAAMQNIVSAQHAGVSLFMPIGSTTAQLAGSTAVGGLYTVGPVLQGVLDGLGLGDQVLGLDQDFAFALAGLESLGGGPTVDGGSIVAASSFVGTAALVPNIPTVAAGLVLLAVLHIGRTIHRRGGMA